MLAGIQFRAGSEGYISLIKRCATPSLPVCICVFLLVGERAWYFLNGIAPTEIENGSCY